MVRRREGRRKSAEEVHRRGGEAGQFEDSRADIPRHQRSLVTVNRRRSYWDSDPDQVVDQGRIPVRVASERSPSFYRLPKTCRGLANPVGFESNSSAKSYL